MSTSRRSFVLAAACGGGLTLARRLFAGEESTVVAQRVLQPEPAPGRRAPPVITCVAISPGGDWIAAGGDDHLLRIWDAQTGKLLHCLAGHADWIRAMAFLPEGGRLITSGNDRRLLMWTIAAGGVAHQRIADHDQAVFAVALNPVGTRLAAIGFEKHMCLYDIAHGGHGEKTGHGHDHVSCPCSDMRCVKYSPDGALLAAAGRNGRIRMWRADDMTTAWSIQGHRQRIRALDFSPNGRRLASAGEDRVTRIWNAATGESEMELTSSRAKLMAAVFITDERLATAGSDNMIRILDLSTGQQQSVLTGHSGSVAALDYRDGLLVSGGYDTTIRLWRPAMDEPGPDWRLGARESLRN